ncbi:MAG: phosphoribosylamine--glycine ligase [Bacteroidota bacterium]|nr:phosphoribosylamine--glycine ligase [Bacteroidota bacterium]
MNILILGSGGREHAFSWKISQSSLCSKLFIAPGNAGTAGLGENIDIDINDFQAVKKVCLSKEIEMVVVGPEEPLVNGMYDFFKADQKLQNIIITGPSKTGAQLEGSKAFAKSFMNKYSIPTAKYREFDNSNFDDGLEYIQNHPLPIVLKADGLAAGKGVIICTNYVEALSEFELMIQQAKFGSAGKKVVVEEFLDGIELSVFVLTDGKNYVILPEAKDYKKIGEGDKGPNTGGMGAISPVPFATEHFMKKVTDQIIEPTIKGLQEDGIDYKGFIFLGLIKVEEEPVVIEYNCRMGDPETEVVLIRLQNDLVELLVAMDQQKLDSQKISVEKNNAVTIVAVSGGYPGNYEKGIPIEFLYLENPGVIKHIDDDGVGAMVFHAGTKNVNDKTVTNGGRVLAVSAMASDMGDAIELSKRILEEIHFEGMYYRGDIGYEFVD